MGQKVNPYGFRLGITTDWKSRWFKERGYKDLVIEDWKIRDYLTTQLESAAVSRIEIERNSDRIRVDIHTARPGIVIGRRGAEAERLKKDLEKITGQKNKISLNIQEIKQPELDAALIAQGICDQLLRRVAFRRAMKRGIQTVQKAGALGVRIQALGTTRRRGDVASRVLPRGSRAAAHAARRHRLRLPRGAHLDRAHRRQGLDLQGRHPALPADQRREDRARGRHGRRRRRCPVGAAPARAQGRRARRRRPPPRRGRAASSDEVAGRGVVEVDDVDPADLLAATDEVERRLSVEEEIERRTAQEHTDTPHFRKDAE